MFIQFDLETDVTFDQINNSQKFPTLGKGRKGFIVYFPNSGKIPLIRSSTEYSSYESNSVIETLLDNINKQTFFQNSRDGNIDSIFNNLMIEKYDRRYKTMGWHSDCYVDLEKGSNIGILSFYSNPGRPNRILEFYNKTTGEPGPKILLKDKSMFLLTYQINLLYNHRIVASSDEDNEWIGVTLRKSKTYIKLEESIPKILIPNDEWKNLRLATFEDTKEFIKHKGRENINIEEQTANFDFVLFQSDLDALYSFYN